MPENKYLENTPTILDLERGTVDLFIHNTGFIIFIVLFVICIPYLLIKYKHFELLAVYFPNLGSIATVIGFYGGPLDSFIWKHLYNPADTTLTGYISSNIINFFSLLGITGVVAYYTFIDKSIFKGWSRAFIMLPMTYFLPTYIIVYYMNKFGNYLNKFYSSSSLMHYLLVVIFGILLIIGLLIVEAFMIKNLSPQLVKMKKYILKNIY